MNSEQERQVFEAYGWRFDVVQRTWTAPDGYVVTTDDLVIASDLLGRGVERKIATVAREHGRAM